MSQTRICALHDKTCDFICSNKECTAQNIGCSICKEEKLHSEHAKDVLDFENVKLDPESCYVKKELEYEQVVDDIKIGFKRVRETIMDKLASLEKKTIELAAIVKYLRSNDLNKGYHEIFNHLTSKNDSWMISDESIANYLSQEFKKISELIKIKFVSNESQKYSKFLIPNYEENFHINFKLELFKNSDKVDFKDRLLYEKAIIEDEWKEAEVKKLKQTIKGKEIQQESMVNYKFSEFKQLH